jgi:integral membrane sensor domain MASE1
LHRLSPAFYFFIREKRRMATRYLKSWLVFFLVAGISGALVGGLVGMLTGAAMGAAGVPMSRIVWVSRILGFLVSMPISFFTFRWSVRTYIVDPMLQRAGLPPSL